MRFDPKAFRGKHCSVERAAYPLPLIALGEMRCTLHGGLGPCGPGTLTGIGPEHVSFQQAPCSGGQGLLRRRRDNPLFDLAKGVLSLWGIPLKRPACFARRDARSSGLRYTSLACPGHKKAPPLSGRAFIGGEGGIRTPGTLAGTSVFETDPFDHSGTSPNRAANIAGPCIAGRDRERGSSRTFARTRRP